MNKEGAARFFADHEEISLRARDILWHAREGSVKEGIHIGYVASPGEVHRSLRSIEQWHRIKRFAKIIEEKEKFPVFTALDLVGLRGIHLLNSHRNTDVGWQKLFEDLVQVDYFSHFYMPPGSENIPEAIQELEVARNSGLIISNLRLVKGGDNNNA